MAIRSAKPRTHCAACKGDGWVPIAEDEVGHPVPCPLCCPDDYSRGVSDERAHNVALLRARAEELRGLAKALGMAPAWAVDRAEELEVMAKRIEGGEE
jgi:hypothetical protein